VRFRGWLLPFFVAVLLAVAQPSTALPPDLSLSQIQHTAWTAKQGAPADIWALAQSSDGFLLLGTGSGLYRFDGVAFERIVASNQPDLAFRDITALLALPSGELWIGYYAGGVSELKNGVLTSYGTRQGVPTGWITSFAHESDGTLWVAALEGLGRFSGGHWETVSSDWNFRGHAAHWVLLDQQGTLWVAGGETVEFLRRGSHRFEDTGIRSRYKSTLALASDGTVWLGGESIAPRPLNPARLGRDEPAAKLEPVKRFLVDREGSIWATVAQRGGIYRATQHNPSSDATTPHPAIEMLTESDGLTSDIAVPVLEDHEGNIWVGTNLGLNRLHAARFVREWRVPTSRAAYALAADPRGSVWIASGTQLFEAYGSRCDLVASLPSPIRSAYRDPSGTLWFGTEESLVELVDKKPKSLPLPASAQPIPYQYVRAMTSDPSHRLLVSVVNRGVLRLDDRQWDLSDSKAQLSEATPTALWTDAAGRQWLGYSDGTAALRAGNTSQVFGADQGLHVGPVLVIRGSRADVFIGGEWGIARFDGRRFRSLSASRSDAFSGISGIILRENGDIWLNGNRGVVRMSPDALDDAYDHPATKMRYDLFDVHDGLPGYAQQGEDASAVAGADGRLWFATNHGIAWIEPDRIATNSVSPHAVIRSVVADQRTYHRAGPIVLPEATRSVRIDYTAPSLAEPERLQFRYKLEGAEDTWRDAGNERSVRYANLSPGQYTFRVIAANNDGVWNDVGATVAFTLRPAFYQTSWFLVLVSAACLGVLWLLLWARLRQVTRSERKRLEQRMEDRLGERTRVARELHDTLLQSFQGVLLRFQVAYELLPARPVEAKQDLANAIDRTVRAIDEGRDAVQGLRNTAVEGDDLAAAIKTLVEELASDHYGNDVVFQVDLHGVPQPLLPLVRDEIYQIAGEALRNARRHAQASEIEVELHYDERQLRLRIRDDGKGIDAKFLSAERATGHYGLHGLRERATLIGGKLAIWTASGLGSEIELTVPAARAYATTRSTRLTRLLKKFSRRESEVAHE
jgi:signal transduction histidine kinase/ligand-binding sensor domain-containing protein